MTTTTDTIEDTPAEAPVVSDHAPSSDYDDLAAADAIDARYKELFAAAADAAGGRFVIPSATVHALQEDHRRAMARTTYTRRTPGTAAPRVSVAAARPVETADGSLVIVCAGPCGEEKPVKKFPTTRDGGRESVCRDCRDTRLAAARKSAK